MGSQRQEIRKKIRELLIGKTKAGDRVFTNQAAPTWVEDLPVILIYPRSESVELFNQAPRELKRDIQMVIEIVASGSEEPNAEDKDTVEDQLDEMSSLIECELARDETFEGLVDMSILTSTDFDFAGEGAKPIGSARLVYTVVYYENSPAVGSKIAGVSPFTKIHADYKVGHNNEAPDDQIEANDDIAIPQ